MDSEVLDKNRMKLKPLATNPTFNSGQFEWA